MYKRQAAARGVLFEWVAEANRRIAAGERLAAGRFADMLHALGMEGLLEGGSPEADPEAVRLLSEREDARAARDFERADRLRDELGARGYEVRDTSAGAELVAGSQRGAAPPADRSG